MQQDKFTFRVGLISLLMILSIAGLLIWKSGLLFKATGYEVIGRFQDISGLLPGAEVRYRGFKVGKVFEIVPERGEVLVHFWISNGVIVPSGSIARVVFDGLVGEKFIAIRPGKDTQAIALKSGDMIDGYASAGLADAIEVTVKNLDHTEAILESFRRILTNKDVADSIQQAILSFEKTATNFSALTSQLNNKETFSHLGETAKNLDNLTRSLQMLVDNVGAKENTSALQQIINNLKEFTDQLKGEGGSTQGSSATSMLKVASKLKVKPSFGVTYTPTHPHLGYEGRVDTKIGKTFLRTAFGDNYRQAEITGFQVGHREGAVGARVGAFYGQVGAGLDLSPTRETMVSLDVFNTTRAKYEVTGTAYLNKHVDVFVKYRSSDPRSADNDMQLGAGLSLKP